MSLADLMNATVDVLRVEDAGTGNRMGRAQGRTTIAAAVPCRINEQGPSPAMLAGHGATLHSHRAHFLDDPGATVGHLLKETDPTTAEVRFYAVVGTRRPASPRMPWVVYCQRTQSAT